MSRVLFPVLLAGVVVSLSGVTVQAQSPRTLAGSGLDLDEVCARRVEIRPDASLHGTVGVVATADHPEEIDRLLFESAGRARIHPRAPSAACWQPSMDHSFTPTLELVLTVPAGYPLTIDEGGVGQYVIGPVGGPLSLDLSGAVELSAASVGVLTAELSGTSSVDAPRVVGNATLDLSGAGHVTLGDVEAARLGVELSGTGSVVLAQGHVGNASLSISGMGSIRIGAAVGDASVDLSGAGTVHFATVTGALHKDVSGIGEVTVGGS